VSSLLDSPSISSPTALASRNRSSRTSEGTHCPRITSRASLFFLAACVAASWITACSEATRIFHLSHHLCLAHSPRSIRKTTVKPAPKATASVGATELASCPNGDDVGDLVGNGNVGCLVGIGVGEALRENSVMSDCTTRALTTAFTSGDDESSGSDWALD